MVSQSFAQWPRDSCRCMFSDTPYNSDCFHYQIVDILAYAHICTGDPLRSLALAHSRAPLFTHPRPHCSHSRAPGEQWARLCVFSLQVCVQAARLCRGSPVICDIALEICQLLMPLASAGHMPFFAIHCPTTCWTIKACIAFIYDTYFCLAHKFKLFDQGISFQFSQNVVVDELVTRGTDATTNRVLAKSYRNITMPVPVDKGNIVWGITNFHAK